MGNPITWRTIMGASPAEAAAPLEYARRAMNDGFSGLNNALTNYQKQQGEVFNEGKAANTQAFYDSIRSQFKTPEEYQAALNSGALDNMRAQYGNQIDTANTSKFLDSRLGDLRTIQEQNDTYNQGIKNKANAPILDAINAAYIKGDFAKADALVAANPGIGRQADLAKTRLSAEADIRARTQDVNNFNFNEKNRTLIEDTKVNQLKAGNVTAQEQLNSTNQNVLANKIVDTISQEYAAKKDTLRQGIKELSSKSNFTDYPKDSFGNVDISKLTKDQAILWNGALKLAKLDTPIESSSALKAAEERLRAAGIPVERTQKSMEVLNNTLTNKATLSKEDQADYDSQRNAIIANKEEHKKSNLFYFDAKTYNTEIGKVFERVDKEIQDGPRTKANIKDKIRDWSTKGIEYIDEVTGNKVTQIVPPNIINTALSAGKEADTTIYNNTDNAMESYIKQVMGSKDYKDMRLEAADYTAEQDKVALKKLKEIYSPKSNAINPADYIEQARSKSADSTNDSKKSEEIIKAAQQKELEKRQEALDKLATANGSGVKSVPGIKYSDLLKYGR